MSYVLADDEGSGTGKLRGALVLMALGMACSAPPAASSGRIAQAIDRSRVVPATGHVHPFAQARDDLGRMDSAFVLPGISLDFSPSPAQGVGSGGAARGAAGQGFAQLSPVADARAIRRAVRPGAGGHGESRRLARGRRVHGPASRQERDGDHRLRDRRAGGGDLPHGDAPLSRGRRTALRDGAGALAARGALRRGRRDPGPRRFLDASLVQPVRATRRRSHRPGDDLRRGEPPGGGPRRDRHDHRHRGRDVLHAIGHRHVSRSGELAGDQADGRPRPQQRERWLHRAERRRRRGGGGGHRDGRRSRVQRRHRVRVHGRRPGLHHPRRSPLRGRRQAGGHRQHELGLVREDVHHHGGDVAGEPREPGQRRGHDAARGERRFGRGGMRLSPRRDARREGARRPAAVDAPVVHGRGRDPARRRSGHLLERQRLGALVHPGDGVERDGRVERDLGGRRRGQHPVSQAHLAGRLRRTERRAARTSPTSR